MTTNRNTGPGHFDPEPDFVGSVGATVATSVPAWPRSSEAGRPGPNVVMVVLDDVGFGQLGCYGSRIDTPNVDHMAAGGLRYTNFHVTAMCSPTRSSLLTGRNHHSVGMGYLADFDTGYPSYRGAVSPHAATVAEMLGQQGWATYALGKWHLTPPSHMSPAGPFDQWPTGRGFDRYYGFLWGEDDQFTPELWYDQHNVTPPGGDYHLSEDLIDYAEAFLGDHTAATPERPFLLYLAFGACHAPHQAPRRYIEPYRGVFDTGWDAERAQQLNRQKARGLVPPGTRLGPRNPDVPAWSELTCDERRLSARLQENFAGFLTHTDAQIGRLTHFLRRHGLLEDTLLLLLSDNGASGEGGRVGTANEYRYFLGLPDSLESNLDAIDELGGPWAHNHYPAGWAQAGNTPLRFYKKHTFGGGIRAPLIVHWPSRVPEAGAVRTQFHHVIDIVPTILNIAGVAPPATHHGFVQMPIHGTSMSYSFTDAQAPTCRETQYFEMGGHRGIWHQGWKAVTYHHPGTGYDQDQWRLYHLDSDFSETIDLATNEPTRLQTLIGLWESQAEAYGVAPVDDRQQERAYCQDPRAGGRRHFTLLPGVRLSSPVVGPNFADRSFRLIATVDDLEPRSQGVLLAHGRRAAGFVFFVQSNRLHFDFNLAGDHTTLSGATELPAGAAQLEVVVTSTSTGTSAELRMDGMQVATKSLPGPFPAGFGCMSTQCGFNSPSPVSPAYSAPFTFTATLDSVVVELGEQRNTDEAAAWRAILGQE